MSIITTYNSLQGQLSFNDNILENSLNNAGFFKNLRQNIFNKFNMFGFYDTEDRLGKTFEYVFFTKPDLFVDCSSLANCIEFQSARQTNPEVINELCLSRGSYRPFSALLYNYRKSNLELPDLEAGEMETGTNMWGQNTFYRRSSTSSNKDFNFTLQFNDNKYLDVYTYFKLYDKYEEWKAYGNIDLTENSRYLNYIWNKILHNQTAIYKFIVGEDGSEIIYYAKLYGVYPKNVPSSVFGDLSEEGNLSFSINFKANFMEDMNPLIIKDFNTLSSYYPSSDFHKLYDENEGLVSNKFADPPFISSKTTVVNGQSRVRYYMRWRW